MYLYFSCEYPSVIKIDGIVYGKITESVKFFNLDGFGTPLIEVVPLSARLSTFAFYPDAEFLNAPVDCVSVTDLQGGYLIKIYEPKTDGVFNVLTQEKAEDYTVTVFSENGTKISIETKSDFYADALPFPVKKASVKQFNLNGEKLLSLFADTGKTDVLEIYSYQKTVKKLFSKSVYSFSTENGLSVTEKFKDVAKHTVFTDWKFSDGKLKESSREVFADKRFDKERLNPRIIPYAFIEELAVNGDFAFYTTGKVKENADKLSAFFGNFIGVCPPPLFRSPFETGLIYKRGKNKYKVEYFTFSLSDGKIENIVKL